MAVTASSRGSEDGSAGRILGRAVSHGQALPLGVDDPVDAARAVRRALADARRRATDVQAMVVATPVAQDAADLARFARRALGPHGADIPVRGLVSHAATAASLAHEAASAFAPARAAAIDRRVDSVAIAVGIDPTGTTVALCLAPS